MTKEEKKHRRILVFSVVIDLVFECLMLPIRIITLLLK